MDDVSHSREMSSPPRDRRLRRFRGSSAEAAFITFPKRLSNFYQPYGLVGIVSPRTPPPVWPLPAIPASRCRTRVVCLPRQASAGRTIPALPQATFARPGPAGRRRCDRIAYHYRVKRRKDSRMSDDVTGSERHRPILHLRQGVGSTSISRTESRRLLPAGRTLKPSTGRDDPDAARRKCQGNRREE